MGSSWRCAWARGGTPGLGQLLRREHALGLSDGKLSLDPSICHVDAWAFERECTRFEDADCRDARPARVAEDGLRAVKLYRGAFLPADDDRPFVLVRRARLRSRFRRHVELACDRLGGPAGRADAERLLRRAVEVDPLAEALHRALMQLLLAQGRATEAVEVHDRLAAMLEAELGARPSPATQALAARARSGG